MAVGQDKINFRAIVHINIEGYGLGKVSYCQIWYF